MKLLARASVHLLSLLLLGGCATGLPYGDTMGPASEEIVGPDWLGDSAQKVVHLDQGWTARDSNWFYHTTQGSQLVPYAFFLALEVANSPELFHENRNLQHYRFIPDRTSSNNPDGLPVGFVADQGIPPAVAFLRDQRSLGLTCAACHTTQINYRGTAMRIDGGPALADLDGFLQGLTGSMKATLSETAKFDRFAGRILGPRVSLEDKSRLRGALAETARLRTAYDKQNHSSVPEGFARLDAFGRIFNNALTLVDPQNRVPANAAVSFPHLWDAPREDFVQWTGVSPNAGVGSLIRNVGEVIGVFAAIDPGHPPPALGYDSSVRLYNLLALEKRLRQLQSPVWPEKILPPIKRSMAQAGREIFVRDCRGCHYDVDRADPERKLLTVRTPIKSLKTDSLEAENIINARGRTGFLEHTQQYVLLGHPIGATDTALNITGNTVLHVLLGKAALNVLDLPTRQLQIVGPGLNSRFDAAALLHRPQEGPQMEYKARALNGIWATAPYLHNGSVANLYELLLPANKRHEEFFVGRREFDPVKVGLVSEKTEGAFRFDASLKGNNNTGHEYGARLTENERWQLLEYLKSI